MFVGLTEVTKDMLTKLFEPVHKVKFICICWFQHHIESD